jgi:hypothetical protein
MWLGPLVPLEVLLVRIQGGSLLVRSKDVIKGLVALPLLPRLCGLQSILACRYMKYKKRINHGQSYRQVFF